VKRITRRDRMRATLREIKEELRRRMHRPIPEQGGWIKQVVRGFFAYYAVPTNGAALTAFYYHVKRIWLRTLRRRSQKDRFSWQRMDSLAADWLPQPRILHPILTGASPSCTQGGSRVRESRPHGSERGAVSNGRPYRTSV
jgi:RNA-directed DNA polymerase